MRRFTRFIPGALVFFLLAHAGSNAEDVQPTAERTAIETHDFFGGAVPQSPADTGFDNYVYTIGNYNGDLIVGGWFTSAGGIYALKIAGWNGSSWFDLNSIPLGNPVLDLLEFGGELYAGYYLPRLNKWDGAAWTELQPYLHSAVGGSIWALAEYNSELIVGGSWQSDNGQPSFIAKWNGAGWDSLGTGISGQIMALAVYNGELIAGGYFTTAAGSAGNRIARWNGVSWSSVGGGMPDGGVTALAVYGGELVAAGSFTSAGGTGANYIAKWNGTSWEALGEGLDNYVEALFVHDGKLIAGGWFQNSGTTNIHYVGSWDGSSWSAVGSEIDGRVHALGEYNGYLIAGGRFTSAGGGYVALWDNFNWQAVSDVALGVDDEGESSLPSSYSLHQNYPNPFNPSTVIGFSLQRRSHATIEILNISGQNVKTLLDASMPAGDHSVTWDGTNESGKTVASGTYFYRLTVGDHSSAKKMVLLK